MLKISNINVAFKNKTILKNSEIIIPNGKLSAICGESGVGKTTLLYIIGLISSFKGYQYEYNGQLIDMYDHLKKANIRRFKIGFIFQDKNLHEYLTIKENLELYSYLSDTVFDDKKALEVLHKVHLNLPLETKTEVLSGGEKQRLAIACALIKDPDLIIADEPTSALDKSNSDIIMKVLKDIANQNKMVVIATHNKNVLQYCDYVYQMENESITIKKGASKILPVTNNLEKYDNKINSFTFNKWYIKFHFGMKKWEKRILYFIPIIIITIVLSAFSLRDGMITHYQSMLDSFKNNEILIENLENNVIYKVKDILLKRGNVISFEPVIQTFISDLTINKVSYTNLENILLVSFHNYQIEDLQMNQELEIGEVYISYLLADKLNVECGDTIALENQSITKNSFTVKGILQLDDSLLQARNSKNVIYLPIQYFNVNEEHFTSALVSVNSFEHLQDVSKEIKKIVPYATITLSHDLFITQLNNLNSYSSTLSWFVVILLFFVLILLSVSKFLSIHNQKYEITVLKANGLSNRNLNQMILRLLNKEIIVMSISVIILLSFIKGFTYLIGIEMVLFSFENVLLLLLIAMIDYVLPTLLSLVYINSFDPEKLLRF